MHVRPHSDMMKITELEGGGGGGSGGSGRRGGIAHSSQADSP